VIKDFPAGVEGFEYSGAAEFDMSWSQECRDQVFVSNFGNVLVILVCSSNFGACSRNFGAVL
jgi:hypothetical protein